MEKMKRRKSMAKTVVDPIFVDTIILIFATSQNAPLYQAVRQKLADLSRDGAYCPVADSRATGSPDSHPHRAV
jgi:hypothetical protein